MGDAPEAVLVEQVAGALRDQATSLARHVELAVRSSVLSADLAELLNVQRVTELAQSAEIALRQSVARGFLGQSLWWWVDFIAELIKKLIDALWPKAPPWIASLLDILDEMLELLKGIFESARGGSATEVHAAGSALRVNSYREQTEMAKMLAARNQRQSSERSINDA